MFEAWQRTLTSCLASVEAVIDFGEDEQLGDHVLASVRPRVQALRAEINTELANGKPGLSVSQRPKERIHYEMHQTRFQQGLLIYKFAQEANCCCLLSIKSEV